MQLAKVPATHRQTSGKNKSRRMSNAGTIPAVAYGKGEPALLIAVSPKDLIGVLAQPLGRNSPIELDVEGKEKLTVLLTDYQYHPVSRSLLHADFLKIALDAPVEVEVPLELTGKPKGVIEGGELRQVYRRVPVRCLPKDIPVKLVHDITELGLDESLPVSALALPAGVTVRLPLEQTVRPAVRLRRGGRRGARAFSACTGPTTAARCRCRCRRRAPAPGPTNRTSWPTAAPTGRSSPPCSTCSAGASTWRCRRPASTSGRARRSPTPSLREGSSRTRT